MRMFGLGVAIAPLVDARLVRMVLLPAFVLGQPRQPARRWPSAVTDLATVIRANRTF